MEKEILKTIVLIFFVITSCSKTKMDDVKITKNTDKGYFSVENKDDSIFNMFISRVLKDDFNEPVLYNHKTYKEIYRLSKLSTFMYSEVIRVESYKDTAKVFLKIQNLIDTCYYIPITGFLDLKVKLSDYNFWNMSSNLNEIGFDGSIWIIEGIEKNNYHHIYRWITYNEKDDKQFMSVVEDFEKISIPDDIKMKIENKYKRKYNK